MQNAPGAKGCMVDRINYWSALFEEVEGTSDQKISGVREAEIAGDHTEIRSPLILVFVDGLKYHCSPNADKRTSFLGFFMAKRTDFSARRFFIVKRLPPGPPLGAKHDRKTANTAGGTSIHRVHRNFCSGLERTQSGRRQRISAL